MNFYCKICSSQQSIRIRTLAKRIYQFFFLPHKRSPLSLRECFEVGRGTYGEPTVARWEDPTTLKIGSFCSIAGGVTIFLGGNHRVDWITTYPFPEFRDGAKNIPGFHATKGDVIIGNDVWIGTGATILSGVHIGNGAVIAACSVVTKNVPSYGIVAGNPAKLVRLRFTTDEIACLEKIAWWDWSDTKIDAAMPFLLSGDISALNRFASSYS
ncbi:MAG TPA: CatB-related O-acetyltransferase [Verrucomicrobiae bacterium]